MNELLSSITKRLWRMDEEYELLEIEEEKRQLLLLAIGDEMEWVRSQQTEVIVDRRLVKFDKDN